MSITLFAPADTPTGCEPAGALPGPFPTPEVSPERNLIERFFCKSIATLFANLNKRPQPYDVFSTIPNKSVDRRTRRIRTMTGWQLAGMVGVALVVLLALARGMVANNRAAKTREAARRRFDNMRRDGT